MTSLFPATQHVLKTLKELEKLLPEEDRAKPQIILLSGEVTPYRNDTDREMVFRQESNFYYLTGCDLPSSSVLIISQQDAPPSVELYIPKAEPADIMWSVPPPPASEAALTHDVTLVQNTDVLKSTIESYLAKHPTALFHTFPVDSALLPKIPKDLLAPALKAQSQGSGGLVLTDKYIFTAVSSARLTKDEYEIGLIRKACDISSRAHETVMRVLGLAVKGKISQGVEGRPLLPGEWLIEKEYEAEAIFVASCRREGSVHQAYLPIVAASTRASTLHYCCNDKEFGWGPVGADEPKNTGSLTHSHSHGHPGNVIDPQVLLIDAGCEWDNYASDITRTMPVGNGGKFSKEGREIYEIVLEMQTAAYRVMKPSVHWDIVHLEAHKTLIRGFQRLGIFYSPTSPNSGSWNSEEAILASGISASFFPHGLGHSLGMDVHDVPSISKPSPPSPTIPPKTSPGETGPIELYHYLRLRLPLESGMVLTNEPGCYFSPHLMEAGKVRESKHVNVEVLEKYVGVGGVRIEDVVLITSNNGDGYENLTKVGKSVEWLEGVCSGEI